MKVDLRTILNLVWDWTLGGLPGWLMLPGFKLRWARQLHLDEPSDTLLGVRAGEIIEITLGPGFYLKKQLVLPKAAAKNLDKAIDLNMRQSLPSGGADLAWCHEIETGEKGDLLADVFLVKKARIDELRDSAAKLGAKLRCIRVAGFHTTRPLYDRRQIVDRPRRRWQRLTAALMVVLFTFLFWSEKHETLALEEEVASLKSQKVELGAQVVELRSRVDSDSKNLEAIFADIELFESEFRRLPILIDLTKTLGDETWLSEVAIDGRKLRLSGFSSKDVAELLSDIRKLPWAQRVDLDGPVLFDGFSRKNRIDLSILLQMEKGERG